MVRVMHLYDELRICKQLLPHGKFFPTQKKDDLTAQLNGIEAHQGIGHVKETCPADVVNIPQNQHSQRKATRHLTTYWPLTATILVAVCFLFAGYWSWKFSGTDSGAMNGITNILKYAYQRAPVPEILWE